MKLETFIQTCKARRDSVCAELERSLERSDVSSVRVMENPAGQGVADFFLDVMKEMARSSAEIVLRLEDDAQVNSHLEYNILSWQALDQDDFGVGWLYSPPFSILDYIYRMRPKVVRKRYVCGAVGTLFRTRDLPWIIEGCEDWFGSRGGNAMDLAISAAVHDAKRLLYVHWPPIVEHRTQVKSSLGHFIRAEHCTMGMFSDSWRRGDQRIVR